MTLNRHLLFQDGDTFPTNSGVNSRDQLSNDNSPNDAKSTSGSNQTSGPDQKWYELKVVLRKVCWSR